MDAMRIYATQAATFQRRFALYLYYRSNGKPCTLPLPATRHA